MLEIAAHSMYEPVLKDIFPVEDLPYVPNMTVPVEQRLLDPRVVEILCCMSTCNKTSFDHLSTETILYSSGYREGPNASEKINARSCVLAVLSHSDQDLRKYWYTSQGGRFFAPCVVLLALLPRLNFETL